MKLSQGLFAALAVSPALMGGVDAASKSVSVHFCKACVGSGSQISWAYDVQLVVRDCYNGLSSGRKGPSSTCTAGDFSLAIDSNHDIRSKYANKDRKLSVKYGGKWRAYDTQRANRIYKNGNKDCYEFYDSYEPSTCNVFNPSMTVTPRF
ncbi:hypothetical protein GGI12_006186 [Dipsacomyces acuminosporus]|nr:hypothetical protein GGI12_006186 [Dipsacomyces acuminosporus]